MAKLKDIQIKRAEPKEKFYRLYDENGLYLQVEPTGSKYWRLRYRFANTEKLLSLGTYKDLSLAEAREKVAEARKDIRNGIDPSQKKQEARRKLIFDTSNTFEIVAEEWMAQKGPKWSEGHANKIRQRLTKYVYPVFGSVAVNKISSLALLDFFRRIEKSGTTEITHRVLQYCSGVFQYAVLTQRCDHNPCLNLRGTLKAHKTTHYSHIYVHELPEFFERLEAVPTSRQNKLAMRFLMLTFVRQGEMRKAKWADIDWEKKLWRLPAATTKMRTDHLVPLSEQALDVLKELKEITFHNPYGLLFPSQNRQKNEGMSENTLGFILKKMGYQKRHVPHGFRAMASTFLNESSMFKPDVIERQLAHMPRDTVRASYNHAEHIIARRQMMVYWGGTYRYKKVDASGIYQQMQQATASQSQRAHGPSRTVCFVAEAEDGKIKQPQVWRYTDVTQNGKTLTYGTGVIWHMRSGTDFTHFMQRGFPVACTAMRSQQVLAPPPLSK